MTLAVDDRIWGWLDSTFGIAGIFALELAELE